MERIFPSRSVRPVPLRLLVAASETPEQEASRRARSGATSAGTYVETLKQMAPDATVREASCVHAAAPPDAAALRGFDGVIFAGSPIQMHEASPETRAAAAFMAAVYASGTPAFGSCAGLQIAAVAAGGTTAPRGGGMAAGIARGIVATPTGRDHPMLTGRPATWDAPAMHSAVVDRVPEGGTVLAASAGTPVQAMEIRSGAGRFWGVQYHPELALTEIGQALAAQADALIGEGLAEDADAVARYADALAALEADADRRDLAWQLGLDAQVVARDRRRLEIANFLAMIAERR